MSMDFDIIKSFNASTSLINMNGQIRIIKEITPAEVVIYQQLMKIKNKNLAQIYNVIKNDDKIYVIQEYVEGETISEYIECAGVMPVSFVKLIVNDICDALDALHRINIVHRDISANNIIINGNGAKLIDFGISRVVKANKARDTQILGTQGYAAPEQFGFGQTTPRSDIYSVGVLMNYMLTSKMPYEKTAEGELEPIILKCIHINENERYQSVVQLKKEINGQTKSFVFTLPGFRTNKWYKKVIAIIYYVLAAAFIVLMSALGSSDFAGAFAWLWQGVMGLIMPVFILMNYNNWSDRLFKSMNNRQKLEARILIAAIFCVISLYFVFMIPSATM